MHLLTTNQAKMDKARGTGYRSAILHLQPAWSYKGVKTCNGLHGSCARCCISKTGHNRFTNAIEARKRRTRLLIDNPSTFFSLLDADALAFTETCRKAGEIPTIRPNGTSDLNWEWMAQYPWGVVPRTGKDLFQSHPNIRWYDYTKDPKRVLSQEIANYALTFSYSERSNIEEVSAILKARKNVAVVFGVRKGESLPPRYKVNGRWYLVIDGDADDLRLPERDGKGVIVGLRYKLAFSDRTGKSMKPPEGFVVTPDAPLTTYNKLSLENMSLC